MMTNDSRSYLGCLNKLVNKSNNAYHHSIGKKLIHADYSGLTEEIEKNLKLPKFKVGGRFLRVRIFLAKVTPKIGQ